MHRDRLEEALEQAATPTLDRMLEQCGQLPEPLSTLVAYIREHLFDLELTGTRALSETGIRSHSVPAQFRAYLDKSIRGFIEGGRLEVGDRLLRLNEFRVGRISLALGFKNHETFLRVYKAWAGELPSEVGGKSNPPEIDYLTWRRFQRRELESPSAKKVIRKSAELYPKEAAEVSSEIEPDPEPWIIVDSKDYLRAHAEMIWQKIRPLTPEQQRRLMRGCEFRAEELFDLLRKKALEAGRHDRQQGIHLAELALISLERCVDYFGDRIHDLRALGHACVGNAHRLAHDFPAADAAFECAEAEWRIPRRDKDRGIWAKICGREAALRICQRNYDAALSLVRRCHELFLLVVDLEGQIRSHLQEAAIYSHKGRVGDSIRALQVARELLGGCDNPRLAFAVHGNLANSLVQAGMYSLAIESLRHCRKEHEMLGEHRGALRIRWLDALIRQHTGDISGAESLLAAVSTWYSEAEESYLFGIVSLDLALLLAEQSRWPEVLDVASETVPILGSLRLHEETLSVVKLLAKAVKEGELSLSNLRRVRDVLLRDPLAELA